MKFGLSAAVAAAVFVIACAGSEVDDTNEGPGQGDAGKLPDGGSKPDTGAVTPDGSSGDPDASDPNCPNADVCPADLQVAAGGTYQALGGSPATVLEHSCVIKKGALYCWGSNVAGQVGDGSTTAPSQIVGVQTKVHQVSTGGAHTCSVTFDRNLWCWGSNTHGQLGVSPSNPLVPTLVTTGVRQVSAGDTHSCAIKSDNTLWCWGNNSAGQANPTSSSATIVVPVQIGADFRDVSVGLGHTCAIKTDDSLWCWGANSSSQLGLGTTSAKELPSKVASDVSLVRAGASTTVFVDKLGAVRVTGDGANGQLGLGSTAKVSSPSVVPGLTNVKGIAMGARGYHVCAIGDGGMKCWGWAAAFPRGSATVTNQNVTSPTLLVNDADSVAAGRVHSCYARANGDVLCWGDKNSVLPGGGGTTAQNSPTLITIP